MENNNNNNVSGIFYGVIGVATLVVAMIGATFAYFSASISTNNNALYASAANIDLQLSNQNVNGVRTHIIPVNETNPYFATGGYVGVNELTYYDDDNNDQTADVLVPKNKNCVDDDGNEMCSVYTFTIKNPSTTTAQKVYAKMDVRTNEFKENTASNASKVECKAGATTMYCNKSNFAFAIFKGTAADVDATTAKWDVDGTVTSTYYGPTAVTSPSVQMFSPTELDMTLNSAAGTTGQSVTKDDETSVGNVAGTAVLGKLGDLVVGRTAVPALTSGTHTFRLAALDQTLKPGGEVTYTVVMWLHENQEDQGDDETKKFEAGITFSTSLGGSGVTAVMTAAKQAG